MATANQTPLVAADTALDAVQTLVSVNNIDQTVFSDSDRASAVKYWDECFFQNTVSEDIYDAIASKSGTASVIRDQMKWTDIPLNYILDKNNLSDTELQYRFQYADSNFFNKDAGDSPQEASTNSNEAPTEPPMVLFHRRYKSLRSFIQDLGIPRLKRVFELRAQLVNKDYPKCKTLDQFLDEYRSGTYDNKKRALIFGLCNNMWGRECFGTIEKQVMDKLKLKYVHQLIGDKDGKLTTPKTRRSHGSIKIMINRIRQTNISDRFRNIGQSYHKEIIYQRKLVKPMEGVVNVVKVTRSTHGYDGFLGYCVGHPGNLALDRAKAELPPTAPAKSFEEFVEQQVSKGSKMNPIELLDTWRSVQPTEVTLNDDSSCESSITNSQNSPSNSTRGTGQSSSPVIDSVPRSQTLTPANSISPAAPPAESLTTTATAKKPAGVTTTKKKPASSTAKSSTTPATASTKKSRKATAPSTPKKPSKAVEKLAPNQKSPGRMKNGLYYYGCDHSDLHNLIHYEQNYFTEDKCSQENYPEVCNKCDKTLYKGKDSCIIGGIATVKCCRNAINHLDHPCVFALCHSCFTEESDAMSPDNRRGKRRRRQQSRKKLVLPGE